MAGLESAQALCKRVDDICKNGMGSKDECIKLLDDLAKFQMTVEIIQVSDKRRFNSHNFVNFAANEHWNKSQHDAEKGSRRVPC